MEQRAARMQSALLHDRDVAVAQTNVAGTVLSSAALPDLPAPRSPRRTRLGLRTVQVGNGSDSKECLDGGCHSSGGSDHANLDGKLTSQPLPVTTITSPGIS